MHGEEDKGEPYDYKDKASIVAFSLEEALAAYEGIYGHEPLHFRRDLDPCVVVIPDDYVAEDANAET